MAFATLPSIFATSVADAAAARGGDRTVVLGATGLTPAQLASADVLVPVEAVFAAWAEAMRQVRDPGFAVFYARQFEVERYPILGFALLTAATVREAIARVIRFSAIVTTSGHWSLEETGDRVALVWHREGGRTLGHRVANEAVIAEAVQALRQILGRTVPVAARFRHAAPSSTAAHAAFFGARIRWAAEDDAFEFAGEILEERPRFANLAMGRYFEAQAEAQMATLRHAETCREAVARLVGGLLVGGEPSLVGIARQLAMSERSLRRALAEEGTSFRRVVDQVRRERAETFLAQSDLSLAEIAFALGFSEHAAFTRAFRRWTGRSPQQSRALAVQGS